jgi:hypothetical protein
VAGWLFARSEFSDEPTRFATSEKWEHHLSVLDSLPTNTVGRKEMIEEAWQAIKEKRRQILTVTVGGWSKVGPKCPRLPKCSQFV